MVKTAGYVFSDKYVTDEEALREFKNYLIINNPNMTTDVFESLEFKTKNAIGILRDCGLKMFVYRFKRRFYPGIRK